MNGTVKKFDKKLGYGFIAVRAAAAGEAASTCDGRDIFVHYSDIVGKGYRGLAEGEEVTFDTEVNGKKGIKAVNVVRAVAAGEATKFPPLAATAGEAA